MNITIRELYLSLQTRKVSELIVDTSPVGYGDICLRCLYPKAKNGMSVQTFIRRGLIIASSTA